MPPPCSGRDGVAVEERCDGGGGASSGDDAGDAGALRVQLRLHRADNAAMHAVLERSHDAVKDANRAQRAAVLAAEQRVQREMREEHVRELLMKTDEIHALTNELARVRAGQAKGDADSSGGSPPLAAGAGSGCGCTCGLCCCRQRRGGGGRGAAELSRGVVSRFQQVSRAAVMKELRTTAELAEQRGERAAQDQFRLRLELAKMKGVEAGGRDAGEALDRERERSAGLQRKLDDLQLKVERLQRAQTVAERQAAAAGRHAMRQCGIDSPRRHTTDDDAWPPRGSGGDSPLRARSPAGGCARPTRLDIGQDVVPRVRGGSCSPTAGARHGNGGYPTSSASPTGAAAAAAARLAALPPRRLAPQDGGHADPGASLGASPPPDDTGPPLSPMSPASSPEAFEEQHPTLYRLPPLGLSPPALAPQGAGGSPPRLPGAAAAPATQQQHDAWRTPQLTESAGAVPRRDTPGAGDHPRNVGGGGGGAPHHVAVKPGGPKLPVRRGQPPKEQRAARPPDVDLSSSMSRRAIPSGDVDLSSSIVGRCGGGQQLPRGVSREDSALGGAMRGGAGQRGRVEAVKMPVGVDAGLSVTMTCSRPRDEDLCTPSSPRGDASIRRRSRIDGGEDSIMGGSMRGAGQSCRGLTREDSTLGGSMRGGGAGQRGGLAPVRGRPGFANLAHPSAARQQAPPDRGVSVERGRPAAAGDGARKRPTSAPATPGQTPTQQDAADPPPPRASVAGVAHAMPVSRRRAAKRPGAA